MKLTGFVISIISIYILTGCNHNTKNHNRDEARQLYRQTVHEIRIYTDSMKNAHDSVEVIRLDDEFRERLTKINMESSPETDALLSEGENDTLFILTSNYLAVKKNRLKKLGTITDLLSDTIN